MEEKIKVLLADDHAMLRKGLGQIFADTPDMELTGEASSFDDLFQRVRAEPWDVIITDISMPGGNIVDAIRQLRLERPQTPILVLTMYPEEQYGVRLIREGISGYVNKGAAPEELVQAVRRVVSGGRYVSQALAERLALEVGPSASGNSINPLSNRELEVITGISMGYPLTEIADRLALSRKTVSTYRSRILAKLGLSSNAEMVQYALNSGLLSNGVSPEGLGSH